MKKLVAPGKPEIALMPLFTCISLQQISAPRSVAEFAAAAAAIKSAGVVGFDTESKPTFAVGETSDGPHVVQFALDEHTYLFQTHAPHSLLILAELLADPQLIKAGFGLRSDTRHIRTRFGVPLAGAVDLNHHFSQLGYQKEIGVRNAIAVMFRQRFTKSKKVTTSNWALPELSSAQQLYAANDAYAALKVLQALGLTRNALEEMVIPAQTAIMPRD